MIKKRNYSSKKVSLFAYKLKCGECKKAMMRLTNGYKCRSAAITFESKCKNAKEIFKYEDLRQAVLKVIKSQIALVIDAESIIKDIEKTNKKEKSVDIKQLKIIQNQINKNKTIKITSYEKWKLGEISKDEYIKIKNECAAEIEMLNEKLNQEKKNQESIIDIEKTENHWLTSFKKYGNIKEITRQIVEELIDVIYLYPNNKIEVIFKYQDEFNDLIRYVEEK